MSDVVERLGGCIGFTPHEGVVIREAATEITTLRAELATAKKALRAAEPYVELAHSTAQSKDVRAMVWKRLKQVRTALGDKDG